MTKRPAGESRTTPRTRKRMPLVEARNRKLPSELWEQFLQILFPMFHEADKEGSRRAIETLAQYLSTRPLQHAFELFRSYVPHLLIGHPEREYWEEFYIAGLVSSWHRLDGQVERLGPPGSGERTRLGSATAALELLLLETSKRPVDEHSAKAVVSGLDALSTLTARLAIPSHENKRGRKPRYSGEILRLYTDALAARMEWTRAEAARRMVEAIETIAPGRVTVDEFSLTEAISRQGSKFFPRKPKSRR